MRAVTSIRTTFAAAVSAVMFSMLVAGCGGSDNKTTSGGSAACIADCDAEDKGCPAAGFGAACKALCGGVKPACSALYDTYATCATNVGYTCGAGNFPMLKDPSKCQAEFQAYGKCASPGDGGGGG